MDWCNFWLNIGIGLLTGFISGLFSGIFVTKHYRNIDENHFKRMESLEYLNTWSKYLSEVHFELLITKEKQDITSLKKILYCEPITLYKKTGLQKIRNFNNEIEPWLNDLNNSLIIDRIDNSFLNKIEDEVLSFQKKIRNIASTIA